MKLKIKELKFLAGRPVCILNPKTAEELSLHVGDRVSISKGHRQLISILDISEGLVTKEEIAVSDEIIKRLQVKHLELVEVEITSPPESLRYIRKKLNGEKLSKQEIDTIIKDISSNALAEFEIAFFVSATYTNKMSLEELKNMTQAIVKSGNTLNLKGKIVDKHCIGGIAGNRTTPIVVSICAAAGLTMPKTSSRAITSAAGTSDTIETIAKVEFDIKTIKEIVKKTNACLVWGGALGLAPADSKIIAVEKSIHIDSDAQMIASILSKKLAVNSKYILMDIPYGKSAKVSKSQALKLKDKFVNLGKMLNLKIHCVLTDGTNPIGRGIGPALEINDVIAVLKNEEGAPRDLMKKGIFLAGQIFEMTGKARRGKGEEMAKEILVSGKAFIKFSQIITAQKGNAVKVSPGKFSHKIHAKSNGKIKHIDNKILNTLARFAGCPEDKFAGVYLDKQVGEKFKKGEKLLTIYAESEDKLQNAVKFFQKNKKSLII